MADYCITFIKTQKEFAQKAYIILIKEYYLALERKFWEFARKVLLALLF